MTGLFQLPARHVEVLKLLMMSWDKSLKVQPAWVDKVGIHPDPGDTCTNHQRQHASACTEDP